jgi:hypothetical protein
VEHSGKMPRILTVFTKMHDAYKGAMNNTGQPPEPNRDVVERAIVEVLGIAQRQGITPADFVRMLDAGMQVSDFLTAMDANRAIDCDFS